MKWFYSILLLFLVSISVSLGQTDYEIVWQEEFDENISSPVFSKYGDTIYYCDDQAMYYHYTDGYKRFILVGDYYYFSLPSVTNIDPFDNESTKKSQKVNGLDISKSFSYYLIHTDCDSLYIGRISDKDSIYFGETAFRWRANPVNLPIPLGFEHPYRITNAWFKDEKNIIINGSYDSGYLLINLCLEPYRVTLQQFFPYNICIDISDDRTKLAIGSQESISDEGSLYRKRLSIYDTETLTERTVLEEITEKDNMNNYQKLKFTGEDKRLIVDFGNSDEPDAKLNIYDLNTNNKYLDLNVSENHPLDIEFLPDGDNYFISYYGLISTVELLNYKTYLKEYNIMANNITQYHRNGKHYVLCYSNHTMTLLKPKR